MFLDNKYTRLYYAIIVNASNRNNNNQYVERHHIIPKCLGGSNDKTNIVPLTGREHFICHKLLTKMTVGPDRKKMLHAAWCFIRSSRTQQRKKITSKQYEIIRQELSQTLSQSRKGINLGRIVSDETKLKLSKASKGKSKSKETKEKMKLAWTTRDKNIKATTREKLSVASIEFWRDPIRRQQQSISRVQYLDNNPDVLIQQVNNLNSVKFTCIHCGKETNKGNYSRWHGLNCKGIKSV